MPLISQAVIDALTSTSTPADIQTVMDSFAAEMENLTTGDFVALGELMPYQVAHGRSVFVLPLRDSVVNGSDIPARSHMNFRIPPGLPPLELFYATAWCHSASTPGGDVQLWLLRGNESVPKPMSTLVTLVAVDTTYEFNTFDVDLLRGDICEVRCNTMGAGEAFSPLSLRLWFKAPLMSGIRA